MLYIYEYLIQSLFGLHRLHNNMQANNAGSHQMPPLKAESLVSMSPHAKSR